MWTLTYGHLFCTFISENQGLEKLRSTSNLRKISGPAHLKFFSVDLRFFSVCHLNFFHVYGINLKKKLRWQTEKKLRSTEKKFSCAGPEIFLRFETDLNFSRPWFSEIKVQIKWPLHRSKQFVTGSQIRLRQWHITFFLNNKSMANVYRNNFFSYLHNGAFFEGWWLFEYCPWPRNGMVLYLKVTYFRDRMKYRNRKGFDKPSYYLRLSTTTCT